MDLTRYRHLTLRHTYGSGESPDGYTGYGGLFRLDLDAERHALLVGVSISTTARGLGVWTVDLGFCGAEGAAQVRPWWGRIARLSISGTLSSQGQWFTPPIVVPIVSGNQASLFADGPAPNPDGDKTILWHLLVPPPEEQCGDG